LIVICSPDALPRKHELDYIQEEIAWFRDRHPGGYVFPVLSSGTPKLASEMKLTSGVEEPLVIDLTTWRRGWPFRDRTELLRIVAPLIGCSYAELRRREHVRARRREAGIAAAAGVLAITTFFALFNWFLAIEQTRIARARLEDALSVGRLVFTVADQELKNVHGAGSVRQHLTKASGDMIQRLISSEEAANDRDVLRVKSLGHTAAGDELWVSGQVDRAIGEYKTALELDARLFALDPTGAERHADLAVSHGKLARIYALRQDIENLRNHAEQAKTHADESLQAKPNDSHRIHALAAAYREWAVLAYITGDWEAARRRLDERLRLATRAAQLEPNDSRFLLTPAAVRLELSRVEVADGDVASGVVSAREALDRHNVLLTRFPDDPDVVRGALMSALNLGDLVTRRGELDEGFASLYRARRLGEDQLARQPTDSETRTLLGVVEYQIAMVSFRTGRQEAGVSAATRACRLTQGSDDPRALEIKRICDEVRRQSQP
jgi:tetratricopeptide (TPR) repeat protein